MVLVMSGVGRPLELRYPVGGRTDILFGVTGLANDVTFVVVYGMHRRPCRIELLV